MTPAPVNSLRELPDDPRDFALGGVFTLPKVEELPEEYEIPVLDTKDQTDTPDFCTAFASCSLSQTQEGVVLSPRWTFAVAKMISGDTDEWGCSLRDVLKAHVKYGAVPESALSEEERTLPADKARRIENYRKELFDIALAHRKGSFWKITGQYDAFDNIRTTMWKFKTGAIFGLKWSWSIGEYLLAGTEDNGYGHAIWSPCGWKTIDGVPYIVIQNSYGTEAGRDGKHLVSRETINAFADRFGVFCVNDMPAETARWKLDNGVREGDNWLTELFKSLLSLFRFR